MVWKRVKIYQYQIIEDVLTKHAYELGVQQTNTLGSIMVVCRILSDKKTNIKADFMFTKSTNIRKEILSGSKYPFACLE